MNSYYDFSKVASGGEIPYDTRLIEIKFNLKGINKEELYFLYSQILDWLVDADQSKLTFDFEKSYYFLGEVETAPVFQQLSKRLGTVTATFVVEPFKCGVSLEGSQQAWDSFCFLEDVLQETEFDVVESKTVKIVNVGRIVVPQIVCDSPMDCAVNGYTNTFQGGTSIDYGFKLRQGENSITILGAGHIAFNFRKEKL
jgi:hypothetical protein